MNRFGIHKRKNQSHSEKINSGSATLKMNTKKRKLNNLDNGGNKNDASNDANTMPIRTLCVEPTNAKMSDQIKSYFEQFGTVNSVKIFALVEFNKNEAAATALSSTKRHRIDGNNVHVEAAEPWHQPDHILNALDDDCLRLILSKLNQSDLTNATNVCVRFKQLAKSVFSTKFKKLKLTKCSHEEMVNSLKTFGSVAQSIDVGFEHLKRLHEVEILTTIAQCCTPVLKELTMHGFSFESQLIKDIKFDSALSKLERLSFYDCTVRNEMMGLMSDCVKLKVLNIEDCNQYDSLSVWPKFDNLEELRLIECDANRYLIKIISMNRSITKLSLSGHSELLGKKPSETVRKIVEYVPNLLELELDFLDGVFSTEITRCLGQLNFLKVLKLGMSQESITLLQSVNATPIEHLELSYGGINTETINVIVQMKWLKVLELNEIWGLTDEHVIGLAKGLGSHLEQLQLVNCTAENLTTIGVIKMLQLATQLSLLTLDSMIDTIDADDYKIMLDSVRKRPVKVKLLIELTGDGSQVNVDKTIQDENRDIFYINETIYPD